MIQQKSRALLGKPGNPSEVAGNNIHFHQKGVDIKHHQVYNVLRPPQREGRTRDVSFYLFSPYGREV